MLKTRKKNKTLLHCQIARMHNGKTLVENKKEKQTYIALLNDKNA
jgi:hypothetical protein